MRQRRATVTVVALLGVALLGVTLAETVVRAFGPETVTEAFVMTLLTTVPVQLGLVVGAYRYRESSAIADHPTEVLQWTLSGGLVLGALIGLFTPTLYQAWIDRVAVVRWAVTIGAGGGFLAGFFNAHVTTQRVAAERAAIRAEEARERRELLEYLNALLRHEVLNSANVVQGWAEILESQLAAADEPTTKVEIIQRQTDEISKIVEDVRVLIRANEESTSYRRTDLVEIVVEASRKLDDRQEAVDIERDLPDQVTIESSELLPRAFENLLRNAVEHNDDSPATVALSAETTDETVTVRIADDGPGIPDDLQDGLFTPTIDRRDDQSRLGTVIVGRLVDQHDGAVEIVETGPAGTTIDVTLPRAGEGTAEAVSH